MREASARARLSLNLQDGILVDAVSTPELANRQKRFQRRSGSYFVIRASTGYGLCDELPLPVQDPPTNFRRVLPSHDNTVDEASRNWAAGRRWEELFNPGMLDTYLEPFLQKSKTDYRHGLARVNYRALTSKETGGHKSDATIPRSCRRDLYIALAKQMDGKAARLGYRETNTSRAHDTY